LINFFKRTSHAPGPGLHITAENRREITLNHNIRDSKTPAGYQHTIRFTEHLAFVR
jgi:hypothetical protein